MITYNNVQITIINLGLYSASTAHVMYAVYRSFPTRLVVFAEFLLVSRAHTLLGSRFEDERDYTFLVALIFIARRAK